MIGLKGLVSFCLAYALLSHAAVALPAEEHVVNVHDRHLQPRASYYPPLQCACANPAPYSPIDLKGSTAIWSSASICTVLFRKKWATPAYKCAKSARILIEGSCEYKVWVSGKLVGTGLGTDVASGLYTALHQSKDNVFIIQGNSDTNSALNSRMIAATVLISYADGSSDILRTDTTWESLTQENVSPTSEMFTSSGEWALAVSRDTEPSSALPPRIDHGRRILDLNTGLAPQYTANAFRKTFTSPPGRKAVSAVFLINVDDHYTAWVNGKLIAVVHGTNSRNMFKVFSISCLDEKTNVFAIKATNTIKCGRVSGKILIMFDDGSTATIVTDGSWKASCEGFHGFENPYYNDQSWEAAKVVENWDENSKSWPQMAIPVA